jgi:hypothetical protein
LAVADPAMLGLRFDSVPFGLDCLIGFDQCRERGFPA